MTFCGLSSESKLYDEQRAFGGVRSAELVFRITQQTVLRLKQYINNMVTGTVAREIAMYTNHS